MRQDKLNELIRQAESRRVTLRHSKGLEYTQGSQDVLSNFKRVGACIGGCRAHSGNVAMLAWYAYFQKHMDALVSFIKFGKESSTESIEGRIDDMQVYLDLFRGLVYEYKALKNGDAGDDSGPVGRG